MKKETFLWGILALLIIFNINFLILVVLESESEGIEGDGQNTCTLCLSA